MKFGSALARFRRDPIARPAAIAAGAATMLILGAALIGVTIRLLPWVLDPTIGQATLAPFAKSLLAVALEAALMIGWPVGWALATQRLVERGEARVLASLGERPARTIARLLPEGIVFGVALVFCSALLGREATAPGRVVNALLAKGRTSCTPGETRGIPFVAVTWLCPPEGADPVPRLVGRAPIGNVVFTAGDAKVSDDLRRIELTDARLALPSRGENAANVRVRVAALVLRGLAPWARASALPPWLRAAVVTGSAFLAGCAAAATILRRRRVSGVSAAAIGASGPVAALAMLRALELRMPEVAPGLWLLLFVLVPLAALVAALGSAALVTALPEKRGADTT